MQTKASLYFKLQKPVKKNSQNIILEHVIPVQPLHHEAQL